MNHSVRVKRIQLWATQVAQVTSRELRVMSITASSTTLITRVRRHSAVGTSPKLSSAATTKKSAAGATSKPSKKPSATAPTSSLEIVRANLDDEKAKTRIRMAIPSDPYHGR